MRILFMGTPDFAAVSLKRLVEDGHEICGVFTQPDKPRNRNKVTFSPVKEYALSQDLTVYQPVKMRDGTALEIVKSLHPELIVKTPVSVQTGFRRYEGLDTARRIGIPKALEGDFIRLLAAMTKLYLEKDCSLVEINPLVETADGRLLALDAKVNFDDNALFRHPELEALRDIAEEDPKEYRASQYDLNYISLDGSIGCLVNGAGLAMATMDIIQKFGGRPANFLDVGGSATTERVTAAFEILLSDPHVRAIFVNIFGGIMKCDIIAEGIVAAAAKVGLSVPLVVRLEGTNVDRGREILRQSGLNIIPAEDMADGAHKAVEAAKGGAAQ